MKRFVVAVVVAACQRSTTEVSVPYARDVGRICDSAKLAGAETVAPSDRKVVIAMWLGANLETQDARDFLVRIQPLEGVAKADALDAEAKRAGLPACVLSAEWR